MRVYFDEVARRSVLCCMRVGGRAEDLLKPGGVLWVLSGQVAK